MPVPDARGPMPMFRCPCFDGRNQLFLVLVLVGPRCSWSDAHIGWPMSEARCAHVSIVNMSTISQCLCSDARARCPWSHAHVSMADTRIIRDPWPNAHASMPVARCPWPGAYVWMADVRDHPMSIFEYVHARGPMPMFRWLMSAIIQCPHSNISML